MPDRPSLRPRDVGLVAVGGAVGAVARVAFAAAFPSGQGAVPVATWAENVVGALLLGVLLAAVARAAVRDPTVRLLLGTGVLGAFTTYSTFAVEVVALVRDGVPHVAAAYAVGSIVTGLVAALAGLRVGALLGARVARDRTPPMPRPD